MEKVNLSISNVLDQAWNFAKQNALMLIVIHFVTVIVQRVMTSFISVDTTAFMAFAKSKDVKALMPAIGEYVSALQLSPIFWLSSIVSIVLLLGFYKAILDAVKGDTDKVSFSSFKMQPMTYVKAIVISYIVSFATVVACCFCILPGIFVGVKLAFATTYQIENPEAGIGESLTASWNMTSGNFWSLLVMGIVAALVGLAGIFLCCVGTFFTIPLTFVMLIITYLTIKKNL